MLMLAVMMFRSCEQVIIFLNLLMVTNAATHFTFSHNVTIFNILGPEPIPGIRVIPFNFIHGSDGYQGTFVEWFLQ